MPTEYEINPTNFKRDSTVKFQIYKLPLPLPTHLYYANLWSLQDNIEYNEKWDIFLRDH